VEAAARRLFHGDEELVQHFVEKHKLHIKEGDFGVVQAGVYTYLAALVLIHAKAQGGTRFAFRHLGPTHGGRNLVVKVLLVEAVEYFLQVKVFSKCTQGFVGFWGAWEFWKLLFYESIQLAVGLFATAAQIVPQGLARPWVGGEEHAVQAYFKPCGFAFAAEHGALVAVHPQTYRKPQACGQVPRQNLAGQLLEAEGVQGGYRRRFQRCRFCWRQWGQRRK